MKTRILESRKRIALVAHDNKKDELIDWAVFNKTTLSRHRLYATVEVHHGEEAAPAAPRPGGSPADPGLQRQRSPPATYP